MDKQEFYIETGRLLYAIAKADGIIQEAEHKKIIQIIREHLKPLDESQDAFGTENAFYTEFEFERLTDYDVKVRDAFQSFIEFAQDNKDDITPELKKLIMAMVEKVAVVYNGTEDSEQALIDRLKRKLDEL